MKRFFSVVLSGAAAALFVGGLAGCPIYPDSPNSDNRVCNGSACYDCPDNYYTDQCTPWQCAPDGPVCPSGYYCSSNGFCVGGGSDVDASLPPTGDCSITGCPAPLVCQLVSGTLQCTNPSTPIDAGHDTGTVAPDAGKDAPDAAFSGCQVDSDCPSGAKCLDGTCVAPADQCFDGTQCPAGDQCVAGVCTPTCATADGGVTCPTGYSCDKNGDCTGNPTPCLGADAATCPNGTVCAQDHCVAPCGAGSTCPKGEVCVQGGCVPDEKPQFICDKEGVEGVCKSGSICIHHSCYIACDVDAGDSCGSADQFNQCKAVQTSTGTYAICGSSTNLGSACDPTQGKTCPSAGVCIDGYCR
jgi:hypothetical protein